MWTTFDIFKSPHPVYKTDLHTTWTTYAAQVGLNNIKYRSTEEDQEEFKALLG